MHPVWRCSLHSLMIMQGTLAHGRIVSNDLAQRVFVQGLASDEDRQTGVEALVSHDVRAKFFGPRLLLLRRRR